MDKRANKSKKKAKWTTLIIIDSTGGANTCNASGQRGFAYKGQMGLKRHLAMIR